MKTIEVVAAIIIKDDKILCVQRGDNKREYIAFKYEFPGGKVEEGETKEEALVREIKEELNVPISVVHEFLTVNHAYPDFNIVMHSFLCSCENPHIQLTEHIDYKWLDKSNLASLDWAAADIPIVKKLQQE
jgi:8-oxo-dGTP diphosphatase